jgi:hypothetical protein
MSLTEQVTKAQVKNIFAKLKAGKTITKGEQAMVAAYEAGTLPELTLEDVATHFGVSRQATMTWKRLMARDGKTWTSLTEIEAWRSAREERVLPSDIHAARKAKLEREIKRLDLRIAEDEKRLISAQEVRETGVRIASVWCAELDAMVSDLPGQLAGLAEADIQPRLKARIEALKLKIRKQMEAL